MKEFSLNPKIVWTVHISQIYSLHAVVKNKFPLLSLIWYLFKVVSGNRYQTRGSNGNALSITTTGDIFVASWVLPLVTRPFLDFVMIH